MQLSKTNRETLCILFFNVPRLSGGGHAFLTLIASGLVKPCNKKPAALCLDCETKTFLLLRRYHNTDPYYFIHFKDGLDLDLTFCNSRSNRGWFRETGTVLLTVCPPGVSSLLSRIAIVVYRIVWQLYTGCHYISDTLCGSSTRTFTFSIHDSPCDSSTQTVTFFFIHDSPCGSSTRTVTIPMTHHAAALHGLSLYP